MRLIIEIDSLAQARTILKDLHFDDVEVMPKGDEREIIRIKNLLKRLGISPSLKGFEYIAEAVAMVYENSDIVRGGTTKILYPEIAKKFSDTPMRTERAIRHAIEAGYGKGDVKLYDKVLGFTLSVDKDKPTNREFIAAVADYLKCEIV